MRFNKLDVPYQWREEFTKYPHGYTIFEALCTWTKQVDNMVDNQNTLNERLDNFIERFGSELQNEVQNTITKWQNEGLLDGIIESALSTELDTVKMQLAEKANQEFVNQQIANVASGTPKGAFETLQHLQNAHPTGTTGIFVISADGKWYYWNNSSWVAGGVYQSTLWQNALTTQNQSWEG